MGSHFLTSPVLSDMEAQRLAADLQNAWNTLNSNQPHIFCMKILKADQLKHSHSDATAAAADLGRLIPM